MRGRLLTMAALCALLLALGAALAEGDAYVSGDFYHATPLCVESGLDAMEYVRLQSLSAGSGGTAEAAEKLLDVYFRRVSVSAARMWGYLPCPVCVQDETDYGEPALVERGGTAVLRVSDAWIASRERFDVFGTAGDERFEGEAASRELARILHGDAYATLLNAAARDGRAAGEALVPQVDGDDSLNMHARHIGGAWYLTFRPGEAARKRMKKAGRIEVGLRLEGGAIRWSDGTLTEVSWGLHGEDELDLKLGALNGTPTFTGDFEGLALMLFREMDANILVIRESRGDGAWLEGAELTLDDRPSADGMNGYLDEGNAVYVCVLTDAEAGVLKNGAFPRLVHPGRVMAEAVADDGWQLAYVSETARMEGKYDYTVFFRDGALCITNNADVKCRPVTVRFQNQADDSGGTRRLDAVPLGETLLVFSADDVDYLSNGEGELYAWADLTQLDDGSIISNYDRVWGVYVGERLVWTHTPVDGAAALNLFIDDSGALYARNNTGEDLKDAAATLDEVAGMLDWQLARKRVDLPAGGAVAVFSADEIAEALRAEAPRPERIAGSVGHGGDAEDGESEPSVSAGPIEWSAALYGEE